MDDLVERLRDWPYQGETMANIAADEITALRARLAEVEKDLASGSFYKESDIDGLMDRAERAEARLADVEAAQIMLRAERDGLASLLLSVQQDSIAATKALATARRDALEEAAKVARDMNNGETAKAIAAAIRALIAQDDAAPMTPVKDRGMHE
jgi:predicted  nucleic acid-binding Zn-ribbon protein